MGFVYIFMVVAAAAAALLGQGVGGVESHSTTIGSYQLILQWPASKCNTLGITCIEPVQPRFFIHRLSMTDDIDGGWIIDCGTTNQQYFSAPQKERVEAIRSELEAEWPNLDSASDNDEFWRQLWSKHASCAKLEPDVYFRLGLLLRSILDSSLNRHARANLPDGQMPLDDPVQAALLVGAIHSKTLKRNLEQLMAPRW